VYNPETGLTLAADWLSHAYPVKIIQPIEINRTLNKSVHCMYVLVTSEKTGLSLI